MHFSAAYLILLWAEECHFEVYHVAQTVVKYANVELTMSLEIVHQATLEQTTVMVNRNNYKVSV